MKNLTEMDSLPHLRNLTEISVLIDRMEDKGEVDDGGKRLAAILPEVVAVLEQHREIARDAATRQKLYSISAATIDRVLAPEHRRFALRGRAGSKPGTLLKHQIPIRTFGVWNQAQPGFVEIDLVGHAGGDACGDFCQTLDVTDVSSGWTESAAVINKAQVWVFEALKDIRARLPFPLPDIDSDNGSEFDSPFPV